MKTRQPRRHSTVLNLGFQIAPMVDVVFVILLFFMVLAGSMQVEHRHLIHLPAPEGDSGLPVEEIAIRIDDDGQVFLNDDALDTPASRSMPELTATLKQLHASSVAAKSDVAVTIDADETARYERIVDTLGALSLANISKVTFQAGAPE